MIQLVLSQWRNVRQRKTTGVSRVAEASSMKTRAAKRKPGDGDVKAEFQISSSDSDESSDNDEDDYEEKVEEKRVASAAKTKIKLNPKTKKVGAPRKHMNITAAGERADRKWYDAAERGRKTAGEVTLADLLKSLDEDQPSLMDTQRRLSGVLFKYAEAESKKPKFKLMKNPVTVMDPFYVLPEKLLAACMKVLPVGNSEDSAISVDASQEGGHAGTKGAKAHKVETVIIRDVGSYTRAQIETFVRVQNLRKDVQLGMDMNKWLTVQGIPALPAEYHDIGNKVAVDILESYPYKLIEGLPNSPEFAYSLLYRATPPPTWFTDAAVRALCVRLAADFPSCRFAGFQDAVPAKIRTRNSAGGCVDTAVRDRVFQQVAESGVEAVLLPLNFQNAHWCCVVVSVSAKRIVYYDPLNQAPNLKSAMAIAMQLKIAGLQDYDVIARNNPRLQLQRLRLLDVHSARGERSAPGYERERAAATPLRAFLLFAQRSTPHKRRCEAARRRRREATKKRSLQPQATTTGKRISLRHKSPSRFEDPG
jgi:hypothetical protein